MPSYLLRNATAEPPAVKGSRFIGDARVVRTEAEARAVWAELRKTHHKARHHCIAWRLEDGGYGRSDDGEPSGTGGPPILRRLEGCDAVDVVVVVTRYYGGTKLGMGGLGRAYGAAARAALEAAGLEERSPKQQLRFRCSYSVWGSVEAALGDARREVGFAQDVAVEAHVDAAGAEALVRMLADRWGIEVQ